VVIALSGLVLNQAIVYLMAERLGWDYRLALAVVVLVVPALSFIANRGWVFSGAR
jgi:putative flippase GtrA